MTTGAGVRTRVRRAYAELSPQVIEQIAQRAAELIRRGEAPQAQDSQRLLAPSELARRLGVSREWVYEHATELGAIAIGDGPKPRLRFDPQAAEAALETRRRRADPAADKGPARRRRPPVPEGAPLLPVYGARSRSVVARILGARRRRR
ncbi:MAG: hypothetical protein JWN10_2654 [Solirubrobacterales bacterium]|nr:hypothetical protein [Solirubrobacterales bacterium]